MEFLNDDKKLRQGVDRVLNERRNAGLEGLTGGLEAVIINTEPAMLKKAVEEFLCRTGYGFRGAFEDDEFITCVLKLEGSADFLFRSRKKAENPFLPYNDHPKSGHMPNTRLETFVYKANDLEKYTTLQQKRGVEFLTPEPVHRGRYRFIQTAPSKFTGNSLGFIQWDDDEGEYITEDSCTGKPDIPF